MFPVYVNTHWHFHLLILLDDKLMVDYKNIVTPFLFLMKKKE